MNNLNWNISTNGNLTKTFNFKSFLKTMSFVNAVAFLANKFNHHPEIIINYNSCTINLITHDENNQVTQKDYDLANEIDKL